MTKRISNQNRRGSSHNSSDWERERLVIATLRELHEAREMLLSELSGRNQTVSRLLEK
jgi:hypothetical protein